MGPREDDGPCRRFTGRKWRASQHHGLLGGALIGLGAIY
jgi:hypothetical protein